MAAMSNYLENKLIDFVFRGQSFTPPTNTWIGLLTSAANDANTGSSVVEVAGGNYARVRIAAANTQWSATDSATSTISTSGGTSATTYNINAITFPVPTGANWGVITSFGMFDAATNGNLLFYGNLTLPKTVNDGDAAPTFSASALSIQLDN